MGYRSDGKLYLKENAFNMLSDKLITDLEENWDKETTSFENDGYAIYAFNDWKWYPGYEDVKLWEEFFSLLEDSEAIAEDDWDFIAIGEDGACIAHKTQEHFGITTTITTF